MCAQIVLSVLVALSLVPTYGQAQSFTIKTKEDAAPGKSIGVTTGSKIHSSVTIALGAKVLNEEKKVEIDDMEYTEKVLEGGDKRPNKFTQTYSKALKGREGALAKQSYAGKTIVYELKEGTYQVTAEGGDVDSEDLDKFAKKANRPKVGQALYPKKAVEVGESWAIGTEALFALIGSPPKDDADITKVRGEGKLVKAYKKNDQQWGVIEITGFFPVKKFGPLVLEKTVDLQFKTTLDTAIDGTSTAGQLKATVALKGQTQFTQNNMTFTMDIDIAGDMHMERTAEK